MAAPAGVVPKMTQPGAATEAAKDVPLVAEGLALLRPEHTPRQFLDALAKAGLLADAVRFLAFLLPRREAVWWAVQCVKQVPAFATGEKAAAALAAAEKWAADPTDDHRRAAYAAGEAAELSTPAGCAAVAAFLSEGSLAPPHLQTVPPPASAGPSVVGSAVVLAAVSAEPEKADEKYRAFLVLGDAVAAGTNRWAVRPGPRPVPTAAGTPAPPPPPQNRSWY